MLHSWFEMSIKKQFLITEGTWSVGISMPGFYAVCHNKIQKRKTLMYLSWNNIFFIMDERKAP
jgi:hypothetical protein